MLKSRSKFPPGGWRFVQPQTGWRAGPGQTFDQVVSAIIKHRQANGRFNLPTGYDDVAAELEAYTEKRLHSMPGTQDYYVDEGGDTSKKVLPPVQRLVAAAGAAVASVRRTKAGVRTLLDWLGYGAKPVDRDEAVARAMVCSKCPLNQKGTLYQWLQARVADEVQALVGMAKDLKLKTPFDEQLEICQACDCNLMLKVWVPLDHILKNTSDESKSRLHESCWITKPR